MKHHVRWAIKRDLDAIVSIEEAAWGAEAWPADEFVVAVRDPRRILLVCEQGDMIVGFVLYSISAKRYTIEDLAVHPDHQWQGIGRRLVKRIIDKLSSTRRTSVIADVPDTLAGDDGLSRHLAVCRFLSRCGFRAKCLPRDRSTYRFTYQLEGTTHAV